MHKRIDPSIHQMDRVTRIGEDATTSSGRTPVATAPASFNDVITQLLPQGHEKLLRTAIFNTITFCSVLVVSVTLVAVYFVLEPFLRPLLWSLLCGSALFPFKHRLTRVSRRWIRDVRGKNHYITVESISLPIKIGNWILDGIIDIMMDYFKLLAAIFVTLLTTHLLIYYFTVTETILNVVSCCWSCFTFIAMVLMSPAHRTVIFSLTFAHLFLVIFFWNLSTRKFLKATSPIIVISFSCQIISFLGTFAIFVVSCITCLTAIGIVSSLLGRRPRSSSSPSPPNVTTRADNKTADSVDNPGTTTSPITELGRQNDDDVEDDDLTSVVKRLLSWIWSWITCLLPSRHWKYIYSQSLSDESSCSIACDDVEGEDEQEQDHESSEVTTEQATSPERGQLNSTTVATSPISETIASAAISPVSAVTSDSPDKSFYRGLRKKSIRDQQKHDHHHQQLSHVFIYALLWTCCLAYVWVNPQVLFILPIPATLLSLRWLWSHVLVPPSVSVIYQRLNSWSVDRRDAILHPFFRKRLLRYIILGDQMMSELLEKSLDTLCSLSVIVMVIVGLFLAIAFLAFQIYGESIHLVNMCGNIVNATLTNHPEFSSLLSSENSTNTSFFDEIIGNAYFYGRKWLKHTIRSVLNVGTDEASVNASIAIEKQLLEVWDRSYHMWLKRDDSLVTPPSSPSDVSFAHHPLKTSADYDWSTLSNALKTLNFGLCFNLFKENLDTVLSVLESLWIVIKGNLSIFMSILTAVISLLLSGSSALLNASLNFIVFSTSLFYLLCASDDQYKPIEWASKMFPVGEGDEQTAATTSRLPPKASLFILRLQRGVSANRRHNNKFVRAFNEAINSVFAASFKMATFYGLYTWLIHTLFQTKLVYIPSVTAALLGAVPFIGSYWASFPAVLELYLINGYTWKSLLMFICSIMPTYIVDSTIYAEIKGGGHPYLTGLSIAGGVFFKGFEGAIFGPILLCCLVVAMNIYTSVLMPDEDDDLEFERKRQMKRMNSTIT